MRKELLLCLALAACKESDAADFSAIKQTRDVHTAKETVAAEATPAPGDVLGAVAEAKSPGASGMVTAEMDDGRMWGASDPENPIRGDKARELAAKFPLPSPDDLGITMLINSKKDGEWVLTYVTKLSLAEVEAFYKTAFAAKGLEVDHRLAVDEGTEAWTQLGADSSKVHALATIKREDKATTVMVQWEPKDER